MGSCRGAAPGTRSFRPFMTPRQSACSLFMRLTTMKVGSSVVRTRFQRFSEATSKPPSALTTNMTPSTTRRAA